MLKTSFSNLLKQHKFHRMITPKQQFRFNSSNKNINTSKQTDPKPLITIEIDEAKYPSFFFHENLLYECAVMDSEHPYTDYSNFKGIACTLVALFLAVSIGLSSIWLIDKWTHNQLPPGEFEQRREMARKRMGERSTDLGVKDGILDWISKDVARYPVTYGLIVANVMVFSAITFKKFKPFDVNFARFFSSHMVLSPHNVIQGRWHTLFTNTVTHVGTGHFLFNMFGLIAMSEMVYEALGGPTFLATYLTSGLISSLVSLLVNMSRKGFHHRSIGASGSIYAIVCIYFYLRFGSAEDELFPFKLVSIFLLFELLNRRLMKNVDSAAHLSGALTGLATILLLQNQEHHQTRRHTVMDGRNRYYVGQVLNFKPDGHGILLSALSDFDGHVKEGKSIRVDDAKDDQKVVPIDDIHNQQEDNKQ